MKRVKLTKLWKLSLALFISLASIGTLINSMDLLASEEFDVNETITMNEDNTQATITLDISNIDEKYTIQSIQNPDGTVMDIVNDPSYMVDENGLYTFIISYIDTTSEEEEELTFSKEVEVTQIKIEEKEEETTDKTQVKQPKTITNPSGDSLTVEFEKDNTADIDWSNVSQVNWNYYDTEKVVVTAVFSGKGTNKTREIEVDIPDGYQIIGYSAKTGTASQNGESILTTTEEVQQAMESSKLTSQNGGAFGSEMITGYKNLSATDYSDAKKSGKIKYTFNSEADIITLTLQVGIDKKLYDYSDTREEYSDVLGTTSVGTSTGQLLDNLKVTLTSGSETLEESVKANVKSTLVYIYLNGQGRQSNIYIDDDGYSPDYIPYGGLLYYYNDNSYTFNLLIDELVMTYSYPEGAEFVGIESENNFTNATNMTYVNDPLSRTLTITYTNIHTTTYITSIAKPLFKLDGDIYGTDGGKQTSAVFNTTTATKVYGNDNYYVVNNSFTTEIIEKDIPLTLTGYDQKVYDYTLNGYDDGYQFLGNHYVTNLSYVDKENVDLEWTFDSSLGIRIAKIAIPSGSTISGVKVYTTKNSSGIDVADMKSTDSTFSGGSIIDADKLGLDKDEYITKIEGIIDSYPAQSGNSASTWAHKTYGYAAYGNVQNGSGGSHTLSLDGASSTSTITTTTTRLIDAGTVSTNTLDDAYYPGDTISINSKFTASLNTYNRTKQVTDEFIQDPNVYIRVPDGFSLDETSIKLTFGTIDVTDKSTLVSKTTEPDGTVVYKYSFNEDFSVMAGIQTKGSSGNYNGSTYLNIDFDLKVSVNNQGTAGISLRDIIMLEGKGNFIGYGGEAVYIRNDDYGLTSTGNNLIAPNDTQKITVIKLPELQVSSGIRVKGSGNNFSTYDGTDSSIAGLSRTKNAEIKISYFNNAPNTFSTASIYFPIPKEGEDYGVYFNNKSLTDAINNPDSSPFTWSANLTGEISISGFTTYYATGGNANTTANDGSLSWEAFIPDSNGWQSYSQVSGNLEDVVFVKFVANTAINSGDSGSFTFELEVAPDSPVDEISYWRTYSIAVASGASAQSGVVGSVLAASPSVGEISGLVFYDNNANGKYDAGIDTVYTGSDLTINLTEKDGKISTTPLTINSDGTYSIEQLKEGEYSISAINGDNGNYHFSKTTVSTSSVIGSNVTANTNHTEGKYEGMLIRAGDTETYENVGIGLVSKIDTTYEFEDRVMNDSSLSGKAKMVISGTQIEYDETLTNNSFPQETFSITPNVVLPEGITFIGWQLYSVDGSNTKTKIGDVIVNSDFKDTAIPTITSGSSLLVKAVVSYGPTITTSDLTKYVGDSVNLLEGVSAVNESGTSITLITAAMGNTEVSQDIPIADNKYTTAGTYEVIYKVTDMATGSFTTENRLVKVNEAPTVSATHQEYFISDTTIMNSVLADPSATWKEAQGTVGSTPTLHEINGPADSTGGVNKIKVEISGPSTDFSVAGKYEVTYTATDTNGKTGSKTVDVLIMSDNAKQYETLTIDAQGFTVENADAKDLTETIVKNSAHAGVMAYQKTVDEDNNVTGYASITSDVTILASQLRAIQDASVNGGIYDLTFTVSKDSKIVSITVKVVVKGTMTPPPEPTPDGDELAITANSFVLENNEAVSLSDASAITKGNTNAILVKAGTTVTNITVDATQLATIKNANEAGGIFDLTYTAEDQGVTISTTVKVVVKGIPTPPPVPTPDGDELAITANGFIVENADASSLSTADAKTNANVVSYLINAKTSVTDITVDATQLDAINATPATGGFYKLTFMAKDQDVTNSTTVTVVVKGTTTPEPVPTPDGDKLAITAEGFTIKNTDAVNLTDATAITKGSALSILVNSGKPITDITVNTTQLAEIQAAPTGGGIYDLTYTAQDQGKTISTTVKVVVEGITTPVPEPTPDGDELAITANGFIIENADAASLSDAVAKTNSYVNSVLVKSGTPITDIAVKASELAEIKIAPASGGIYDLTFTAKDQGVEVSTTVKVVVKGTTTPDPKPTPDGDKLAISAQGFTITNMQAKILTDTSAITNGNASAWLVKSGTPITNLNVDVTQLTAIHNVGVSGGIYDLTYTAEDQGVKVITTIKVVVRGVTTPEPEPTPDGDELAITAKGFVIENANAVGLDTTASITNGNASAWLVNASTNITDLTVDATQLATINATGKEGGVYDLTYTAKDQGVTITTTVKVVVKGTTTPDPKSTPDDDKLAITAKGFVLENTEASSLDNATAKIKGQVESWLVNAKTIVTDITAKSTDLTKIQAAPKSGGIYDLTYTAKDQSVEITSTIKVVVKGTTTPEPEPTPDGDKLAITAQGFELENSEATSLMDVLAITKGGTKSYLVTSGIEVTNITVDATQLAAINSVGSAGGIYDLTYTAEDQGVTISTTVKVVVKGINTPEPEPTPDDDILAITANGFILENVDASSLTDTKAISEANVEAWLVKANSQVTNINVNQKELEAIQNAPKAGGIYLLTYTAEDQGVSVSTTVKVLVLPTTIPPVGNVAIDASGYVLSYEEALVLSEEQAIKDGKAIAYEIIVDTTGKIVDVQTINVTVDKTQLAAIHATGIDGGEFKLTYSTTNGIDTAKIEVTVLVNPKNSESDLDMNVVLKAQGFILENSAALSLDTTKAVSSTNGNALAYRVDYTDGEVTGRTDISSNITVNKDDLKAIQSAPTTGGIYELTFTVQDNGITVNKTVKVLVKPLGSVSDSNESVSIYAKGFTLEYEGATILNDVVAKSKGTAIAYKVERDEDGIIIDISVATQSITVDSSQLKAINNAPTQGGIYDLTYTIEEGTSKASITVKVFVKPKHMIEEDGLVLGAQGFSIKNEEASSLDTAKAVLSENGNASAFKYVYDTDGNLIGYSDITSKITVDAKELEVINKAPKEGGIYNLTFYITETVKRDGKDVEVTLEKTVKVVVEGTTTPPVVVTPDGDELAIRADDFTIKYTQANTLDDTQVIVLSNVEAWLVKVGTPTEVTVNIEELEIIQKAPKSGGVYNLTFNTQVEVDGEVVKNQVTIKVTVLPEDDATGKPSTAPTTNGTNAGTTANAVNTSDMTNMNLYLGLAFVSLAYLVIRRKNKGEKES